MMSVKSKFHKAFTLAELMVILAIITVVIAAVAPVLTARYNTLMSSEVWHEVPADDDGDIFTDGINHSVLQQIMIGVSPLDLNDIKTNYTPYAKLVIRASDRIGASNIAQKLIGFYHNDNNMGSLAAGKDNLLLAGSYESLSSDTDKAIGNTAYGYMALNNITTGSGNTAVGYKALSSVTTGNFNTAVGNRAGSTTTNGNRNVYIGYNANASGSNNTIISNNTNVTASGTTAVGDAVSFAGNNNVAIGYAANASGNNNTIVGPYARSGFNANTNKTNSGSNNTAIGYMACANLGASASNKTCIGQAGATTLLASPYNAALSGSESQVLIGRGNSQFSSPASVVVSSSTGEFDAGDGKNIGNGSVVVYGNLIVRGQTYMYGRSPFPQSGEAFNPSKDPSLMGYVLFDGIPGDHKPYVGLDGSGTTLQLSGVNGDIHQVYGGREHCICTQGLTSYDWTSSSDTAYPYAFDNLLGGYSYFYAGDSGSASVELSRAHALYTSQGAAGSCCPILTQGGVRRKISDARLKNIGEKFTFGLDKLEKLKIYNYTFKADKSKAPHVGVIAQDLKAVFPNAVSKDEKGYYKIRWDEMFYSAINSVKELNAKIVALCKRVQNDIERIAKLKKENKQLEDKILKLADEVEKLEQNK